MAGSNLKRLMLSILVFGFGVAGCGGDLDDLDQFINETKARPGGHCLKLRPTRYSPTLLMRKVFAHRSCPMRRRQQQARPVAAPGLTGTEAASF